jgi:Prokaryotic cytochrome b561
MGSRTGGVTRVGELTMGRDSRAGTDAGTVLLHWLLVAALIVSLATGLRIAADDPALSWLLALDAILPQGAVWTAHLAAGVALLSIAAAYVVYMSRAGLVPRLGLHRRHVAMTLKGGRAAWRVVNVVLYQGIFAILVLQGITGILLARDEGGVWLGPHRALAYAIALYPFVHIAALSAFGGVQHLLRMLRPRFGTLAPDAARSAEPPAAPLGAPTESAVVLDWSKLAGVRKAARQSAVVLDWSKLAGARKAARRAAGAGREALATRQAAD